MSDADQSPVPKEQGEDHIQFFAKRVKIYPRAIAGTFRRLKWLILTICLGIYYVTPFLRWDRGENAPDQAVLIDIPARRAYFFFIEIWPQEVYLLTGVLILAAVVLFFATALFGRVWCGYLCFQTVWTDLFMLVERKIQGDRNARMKLDQKPWSFDWIWRKAATHIVWVLIGLVTAGTFVFYFNDAPILWSNLIHGQAGTTVWGFIAGLTISTYVMAGIAREQVCTFMCPYARFQSAMFDNDSLIIGYDEQRGEPRGKKKKDDDFSKRGHCIDCDRCVQVCPTGIDIRDGLQIQCIACGLCIDACNDVMDKLGLPRGLVRYDTANHMKLKAEGKSDQIVSHFARPRTYWYLFILAAVAGAMIYALASRVTTELHVLHDRNPLMVQLSDGSIRNGYEVKILNKTHEDRHFKLTIDGLDDAQIQLKGVTGGMTPDNLFVAADAVGNFRIFVIAPAQDSAQSDFNFAIKDINGEAHDDYESVFISQKP